MNNDKKREIDAAASWLESIGFKWHIKENLEMGSKRVKSYTLFGLRANNMVDGTLVEYKFNHSGEAVGEAKQLDCVQKQKHENEMARKAN